jgi:hypothetical protein
MSDNAQMRHIATISIKVTRADGTVEDLGEVSKTEITKAQFQEIVKSMRQKIFGKE